MAATAPVPTSIPVRFFAPEPGTDGTAPLLGLEGPGSVTIGTSTLRILGQRRPVVIPVALAVLGGLIALVGVVVVLVSFDVARHLGTRALALVGLAAGVAPGLALHGWLRRILPGRTLDVTLPRGATRLLAEPVVSCDLMIEHGAVRGRLCVAPADPVDTDVLALGLVQGLASPVPSAAARVGARAASGPAVAAADLPGPGWGIDHWAPDTLRTSPFGGAQISA